MSAPTPSPGHSDDPQIEKPRVNARRARLAVNPYTGQQGVPRTEFAFLRAVLQGLSVHDAAARYLEEKLTLPDAKLKLQGLRVAVLAAARRAGAYGNARALAIDIEKLPPSPESKAPPTLEEFQQKIDRDEVYSQNELLKLYAERYPPSELDRKLQQLNRLRDRQRKALDELEPVLVQSPNANDPLASWLDHRLAERLTVRGYSTPREVVDWINRCGSTWWRNIPGIGAVAAKRVVDWIQGNEEALELQIKRVALVPRREMILAMKKGAAPVTGVVPLERLRVPTGLEGNEGTNRSPTGCQLSATNDLEAVHAWLAARAGGNSHTERAYRKEAERLLLWSIVERRKPLSSLNVDDVIAFRSFLDYPQPVDRWVGRSQTPRFSPEWRPFTGPLSGRSLAFALTVVGSLFDWLVQTRYLLANPFVALPKRPTTAGRAEVETDTLAGDQDRHLSSAQWRMLRKGLNGLADDESGARTRFAFLFAYGTGLRAAELVDARIGRLRAVLHSDADEESSDGEERAAGEGAHTGKQDISSSPRRQITLRVLGKGDKIREIPFVLELESELNRYLAARDLPAWEHCSKGVRLIARLHGDSADQPLSTTSLYRTLKGFFREEATMLRHRKLEQDAEVFERASTHWLRHTFGRHTLESGVKINVLQQILGHASVQTTTLYSSGQADQAHREMEAFGRRRLGTAKHDNGTRR